MEVQRSHDCWPDYWGRFRVRKRCKCFADSAFHQLRPFLSFYRAQIGSVFAISLAAIKWRTCVCGRPTPSFPRMLPGFKCSFGIPRTLGRILIQSVGEASRHISRVAVWLVMRARLQDAVSLGFGLRGMFQAPQFNLIPWKCAYSRCGSSSLFSTSYRSSDSSNMASAQLAFLYGVVFWEAVFAGFRVASSDFGAGLRLFGVFFGGIEEDVASSSVLFRLL